MGLDGALKSMVSLRSVNAKAYIGLIPLSPPWLIGRSLGLLEIWRWSPTVHVCMAPPHA